MVIGRWYFVVVSIITMGVIVLPGCTSSVRTDPRPRWTVPSKTGFLRLAVHGEANQEDLAISSIPDDTLPQVFADAVMHYLIDHKNQLPEGLTDADIKLLADSARDAFRSVKASPIETQTVQMQNSVVAYRLFEMNREEIKQGVEPVIRATAKVKSWDQDRIASAVNESIITMESVR